jgi:hypothetical protein
MTLSKTSEQTLDCGVIRGSIVGVHMGDSKAGHKQRAIRTENAKILATAALLGLDNSKPAQTVQQIEDCWFY